jgi:hypothetical protein
MDNLITSATSASRQLQNSNLMGSSVETYGILQLSSQGGDRSFKNEDSVLKCLITYGIKLFVEKKETQTQCLCTVLYKFVPFRHFF